MTQLESLPGDERTCAQLGFADTPWRMSCHDLRHAYRLLAGLTLGVCVTNGFARFAYGLLLPAMRDDLGWSYAQAGWLNTANALGYVVGALATVALVKRVSGPKLFAIGACTTALALLATGFDEGLWTQTLGRVAAGLFGAMSFVSGGALAAGLFPGDARRIALAIAVYFGVGGGLGIVLAGAILPPILGLWGNGAWSWGWIGIGTISLLFCIPCIWAARQIAAVEPDSVARAVFVPRRRMIGEMAGYGAFGMGYIVYLTFIAAWMTAQDASPIEIAMIWILVGAGIVVSPFAWRGVFTRFASGLPLAMVLVSIALGSVIPLIWPALPGLVLSALVFGLSVFMAPGAITNFTRQNLPPAAWSASISQFTVVFACAQTLGPIGAGLIGDMTGDIGHALIAAAVVLTLGAVAAVLQPALDRS